MPGPPREELKPDHFALLFNRLVGEVGRAVRGKEDVVRLALITLLAEGHLLIEDVPGVGKTLLAKALARATGCTWQRVQFTPDLLPTDITGVNVFDQRTRAFRFRPGPVFANLVLGDEINRASPKTQSALLEAMEEGQVTVDGVTHPLPRPFMVLATQNPVEQEGTYPLPIAQLDRFMARVSIGYPSPEAEVDVLMTHGDHTNLDAVTPVLSAPDLLGMAAMAKRVHVSPSVYSYIADLAAATRDWPGLALGASPRASLALLRTARVHALSEGRPFLTPDDVKAVAVPVLAHRLLLSPEAEMRGKTQEGVVGEVLERVPVPLRR